MGYMVRKHFNFSICGSKVEMSEKKNHLGSLFGSVCLDNIFDDINLGWN